MNKNTLITILIGLVLVAVAFFTGRCTAPSREIGEETHSDTIHHYSKDTVFLPKDSIVYKWKRVTDTLYLSKDTALLVEEKCYEDSLSRVVFTGIDCELDTIIHFIPRDTLIINTETTITIDKPQKRWKQFIGVGVHLGVSAGYNPIDKNAAIVAPEIGVGFVYGVGYTW